MGGWGGGQKDSQELSHDGPPSKESSKRGGGGGGDGDGDGGKPRRPLCLGHNLFPLIGCSSSASPSLVLMTQTSDSSTGPRHGDGKSWGVGWGGMGWRIGGVVVGVVVVLDEKWLEHLQRYNRGTSAQKLLALFQTWRGLHAKKETYHRCRR